MTSPTSGTPSPQEPHRAAARAREAIAAAMAGLDGLDERPLAEHVEVFDRIHATLADALADTPQQATEA